MLVKFNKFALILFLSGLLYADSQFYPIILQNQKFGVRLLVLVVRFCRFLLFEDSLLHYFCQTEYSKGRFVSSCPDAH